jgi:hypothetical protein
MTRRFTRSSRHPFQKDEASHVVDEVRHSDLASRANDADGAHDLGSHAVLSITKYGRLSGRDDGSLLRRPYSGVRIFRKATGMSTLRERVSFPMDCSA